VQILTRTKKGIYRHIGFITSMQCNRWKMWCQLD